MAYNLTDDEIKAAMDDAAEVAMASIKSAHGDKYAWRAKYELARILIMAACKALGGRHAEINWMLMCLARANANLEAIPLYHADAEDAAAEYTDLIEVMSQIIEQAEDARTEYELSLARCNRVIS